MPQFVLTEEEKKGNIVIIKPMRSYQLKERVLDWDKYMRHKGKLTYSSGLYMVDVEPFSRLKIMMLCDIIMDLISIYQIISTSSIIFMNILRT